jgi:hypothetical protein
MPLYMLKHVAIGERFVPHARNDWCRGRRGNAEFGTYQ